MSKLFLYVLTGSQILMKLDLGVANIFTLQLSKTTRCRQLLKNHILKKITILMKELYECLIESAKLCICMLYASSFIFAKGNVR